MQILELEINKESKNTMSSIEAERALLGAMMNDYSTAVLINEEINTEFFYIPHHQFIYHCISDIIKEFELAVDVVSVFSEMEKQNKTLANEITLKNLFDIYDSVISYHNFKYHIKILKQKKRYRDSLKLLEHTKSLLINSDHKPNTIIETLQQDLYKINELTENSKGLNNIHKELDVFEKEIEARMKGEIVAEKGISTGYKNLDDMLGDGLSSGLLPKFYLIGGRPAMAKTGLALNIAANIAIRSKKSVGFFSLEMTKESLTQRIIVTESEIPRVKMKIGLKQSEFIELKKHISNIKKSRIEVSDLSTLTPNILKAEVREFIRLNPNVGCIVVDYLQLMSSDTLTKSRQEEISQISRMCKIISKEFNITVIGLVQLNRGVEQRPDKRPKLSDLRESGSLEQDADAVMLLYRDEYYYPETTEYKGQAEVIIVKNREGAVGKCHFYFEGVITKFTEIGGL